MESVCRLARALRPRCTIAAAKTLNPPPPPRLPLCNRSFEQHKSYGSEGPRPKGWRKFFVHTTTLAGLLGFGSLDVAFADGTEMGWIDLLFELEREPLWFDELKKKNFPKYQWVKEPKKVKAKSGSPSRKPDAKKAEAQACLTEYCCHWIERRSQPGDNHVTEIYKDYDLYVAAEEGNLDGFRRILDRVSAANKVSIVDILCRLSPAGNTYLHVASKHGHEDIVNFVAANKRSVVLFKNLKGETALHFAVKAGHESVVKALALIHQDLLVEKPLPENEPDANNLLRAKNERGNTALHEALFNGWDSIAEDLIKEDPELLYYKNKDGESALYLAAKAGFAHCGSSILALLTDQEQVLNELFKEKSPIEAAIQGKHRDVLEAMFVTNPSFIRLRDGEGKNPLHYAASLGYLEEVHFLLNQYAEHATERDIYGLFPIHWASIKGHVDVVRRLLQDCPDPGELLDSDDRNILHVAVMCGRSKIVSFILKHPDLDDLINMRDGQGNTPLHLAAMYNQPKIVGALTWDRRVHIDLANDCGVTALDIALYCSPYSTQFTQILTWAVLKAAGTPQYLLRKTVKREKSSNLDKDMVNTLLLVSVLVATVTYAAGFTVPGGYNSSEADRDVGMATMWRDRGFHTFVFCDTIAMYSSIVVAVVLIWAQFGDPILVLNALTLAVPFLGVALGMMSVAFMAGVFVAVSKLRWLSTAVLVIGITFLVILFLLFLPLCTPLTSRSRILRYLSYYPLCLLIVASSKCLAG